MKLRRFSVVLTLLFLIFSFSSYAEIFSSADAGFALDLPEGFALTNQDGNTSFQFVHTQLPVEVIVKIYPLSRYEKSAKALDGVYKQLSAEGSYQNVEWRNSDCQLGTFAFGQKEGWSLAAALPLEKGILVLLVFTDNQYAKQLAQFEVSIVDSLCIDHGSFYSPGPVTSYAYPPEEETEVTVNIAGKNISTSFNKIDEEANRFVIEREFAVLSMYVQSSMRNAAWKRYYRMIYRDAYKRFRRASFDIYNALYEDFSKEENKDLALAQMLLSWVQNFEYERDRSTSDFAPLTQVFENRGSDCDSRSMLLCILLSQMNYDTNLFISAEYQHAFFGINIEGKGAHLSAGGKKYLLGETTAKVNIGLVPQEMSEISKWMSVLE